MAKTNVSSKLRADSLFGLPIGLEHSLFILLMEVPVVVLLHKNLLRNLDHWVILIKLSADLVLIEHRLLRHFLLLSSLLLRLIIILLILLALLFSLVRLIRLEVGLVVRHEGLFGLFDGGGAVFFAFVGLFEGLGA